MRGSHYRKSPHPSKPHLTTKKSVVNTLNAKHLNLTLYLT